MPSRLPKMVQKPFTCWYAPLLPPADVGKNIEQNAAEVDFWHQYIQNKNRTSTLDSGKRRSRAKVNTLS
ncbi:hypothetical protein OH492_28595 [Vibrio chagasii]|nr:hypothetical protein [Vibrio chagasii]